MGLLISRTYCPAHHVRCMPVPGHTPPIPPSLWSCFSRGCTHCLPCSAHPAHPVNPNCPPHGPMTPLRQAMQPCLLGILLFPSKVSSGTCPGQHRRLCPSVQDRHPACISLLLSYFNSILTEVNGVGGGAHIYLKGRGTKQSCEQTGRPWPGLKRSPLPVQAPWSSPAFLKKQITLTSKTCCSLGRLFLQLWEPEAESSSN